MRISLAVVGKPRDRDLAAVIREYETRAARYWPLEVHEVKDEGARGAAPEDVMRREGERLESRVGSARMIVCDVDGERMSSEAFSAWLQRARESAQDVSFVIGGAFGIATSLRERATSRLSLASWTMPHDLARLVLVEQLYRAGTIVRGEPYHK